MSVDEFLEEWHGPSPCVRVQTSGSTGAPKTLLVEKSRMLASARMTNDYLGLRKGDTALLCLSPDYIAGKMMIVRSLERGLQLVTVEPGGHPLAAALPAFSAEQGIAFAAMVPMQVWNSLQVPEEHERLRQVRHLIIGGGAISPSLAGWLRAFPHAVWSTYGMTETLSHIALRRLSGPGASDWYTPLPGVSVSLSGEGCLVIDAPAVSPCRLETNDMAGFDGSSSRFRILGRKDNIICSGGLKISAEQIEEQLRPYLRHPYLISKRPDAKFGEAVVLLTEGPPDEARQVCERILPQYHHPRSYVQVARIPLTATGKPARAEAMRLCRGGVESQVYEGRTGTRTLRD